MNKTVSHVGVVKYYEEGLIHIVFIVLHQCKVLIKYFFHIELVHATCWWDMIEIE